VKYARIVRKEFWKQKVLVLLPTGTYKYLCYIIKHESVCIFWNFRQILITNNNPPYRQAILPWSWWESSWCFLWLVILAAFFSFTRHYCHSFRITAKLYENLEWNSRSCTQNPTISHTLCLCQAIDLGYELSSPAVLNIKFNWNEDIAAFIKETMFYFQSLCKLSYILSL
jgi:hypothetical protein